VCHCEFLYDYNKSCGDFALKLVRPVIIMPYVVYMYVHKFIIDYIEFEFVALLISIGSFIDYVEFTNALEVRQGLERDRD